MDQKKKSIWKVKIALRGYFSLDLWRESKIADVMCTAVYIPFSIVLHIIVIGFDTIYICMTLYIAYRIKCFCILAKDIGENDVQLSTLKLIKELSKDHTEIFQFDYLVLLWKRKIKIYLYFSLRLTQVYSNSISSVQLIDGIGTLLWISFLLFDEENVRKKI